MARIRPLLLPALVATALLLASAWSGLQTSAFTDFEVEAADAVTALQDLDLRTFLDTAPAYGGSLLLRGPALVWSDALGGGLDGAFRALAVPALLALLALALALWKRMSDAQRPWSAWLALGVSCGSPLLVRALQIGHAEEILGAALVGFAALAATGERPTLSGIALGLAVVNKPWAILAILPIVLILQRRRLRAMLATAVVGAIGWAPLMLGGAAAAESVQVAQRSTGLFLPWHLWWFFGAHDGPGIGFSSQQPGFRQEPAWVSQFGHPLVVAIPIAIALAFILVRRRQGQPVRTSDGLTLLALSLLLRCLLDPWNQSYYSIPFLTALLVWELQTSESPPYLTALVTALCSLSLVQSIEVLSPDLRSVAYLVWAVPLMLALAMQLFAPQALRRLVRGLRSVAGRHAPVVLQLGRLR